MSKKPSSQSPVDIAREAFQQLAVRRVAPTPEAYRAAYEEIVGTKSEIRAETVLAGFAVHLTQQPGDIGKLGLRLSDAFEVNDWQEYGTLLDEFVEQYFPA